MPRVGELINSLSELTDLSTKRIYDLVVKNKFSESDDDFISEKNNIARVIDSLQDLINHFTSERIKYSSNEKNRENIIVVEENLELLREFYQLALYAEDAIDAKLIDINKSSKNGTKLNYDEMQ